MNIEYDALLRNYVNAKYRRKENTVIMIYNGSMYNGQGSNFGENKGQH